jgi:hypothetical protein
VGRQYKQVCINELLKQGRPVLNVPQEIDLVTNIQRSGKSTNSFALALRIPTDNGQARHLIPWSIRKQPKSFYEVAKPLLGRDSTYIQKPYLLMPTQPSWSNVGHVSGR